MKTLIKNAVLFTTLLILLGCIETRHPISTNISNTSTLQYINSATFDESLSNAMKQEKGKIEVSVLTPFSPNNVPKRLDVWFTVIKEKGGGSISRSQRGDPPSSDRAGLRRGEDLEPITLGYYIYKRRHV